MRILGLTGGIGSGKTLVAELFRTMGVPVYDSDQRSKALCNSDPSLIKGLTELFGAELYEQGFLNRSKLAERIFGHAEALKSVNALIHPAVQRDFSTWVLQHREAPIVLMETAILFEAGLRHLFDAVICVSAPESLRVARVCKRNGLSEHLVRVRMESQLPENERLVLSDYIVVNDDVQAVIPQVQQIIRILSLSH